MYVCMYVCMYSVQSVCKRYFPSFVRVICVCKRYFPSFVRVICEWHLNTPRNLGHNPPEDSSFFGRLESTAEMAFLTGLRIAVKGSDQTLRPQDQGATVAMSTSELSTTKFVNFKMPPIKMSTSEMSTSEMSTSKLSRSQILHNYDLIPAVGCQVASII
jgi:hypothetical protein